MMEEGTNFYEAMVTILTRASRHSDYQYILKVMKGNYSTFEELTASVNETNCEEKLQEFLSHCVDPEREGDGSMTLLGTYYEIYFYNTVEDLDISWISSEQEMLRVFLEAGGGYDIWEEIRDNYLDGLMN